MFWLDCLPHTDETASTAIDLWHQRLGHVKGTTLKKLGETNNIIFKDGLSFCKGCVEGKLSKKPFKSVGDIRSTHKLQLVHSDICTMEIESMGGSKYFVTFIDDYSRYCTVYFMKSKAEVLDKLRLFQAETRRHGYTIATLRSDNGGEYTSNEFTEYLRSQGIYQELTAPYTPDQNGVSERFNRTLCEFARAMLCHADLSKSYWAEVLSTAAYIRNRVSTSAHKDMEHICS